MKSVVVSAVNLVEGGTLKVLRDVLTALSARADLDTVALVNGEHIVDGIDVNAITYPAPKTSWRQRLRFEWRTSRDLARELSSDIWLAMHDMTPNVAVPYLGVYCHNASPFYRCSLAEAWRDPKFFLFSVLYGSLYAVRIRRADLVIVQQAWLRDEFRRRFGVKHVLVAYPEEQATTIPRTRDPAGRIDTFLYPSFPRVFKNFELLGEAARLLERDPRWMGTIRITVSGDENRYAASLKRRFGDLRTFQFIGLQDRGGMEREYDAADCLLFPSRLETWGLPLTEAKAAGLPIVAADLGYAHETVGSYDRALFVNPVDPVALASQLMELHLDGWRSRPVVAAEPAAPFARGWPALVDFVVGEADAKRCNSSGIAARGVTR